MSKNTTLNSRYKKVFHRILWNTSEWNQNCGTVFTGNSIIPSKTFTFWADIWYLVPLKFYRVFHFIRFIVFAVIIVSDGEHSIVMTTIPLIVIYLVYGPYPSYLWLSRISIQYRYAIL